MQCSYNAQLRQSVKLVIRKDGKPETHYRRRMFPKPTVLEKSFPLAAFAGKTKPANGSDLNFRL
jgi:hypothetical protein